MVMSSTVFLFICLVLPQLGSCKRLINSPISLGRVYTIPRIIRRTNLNINNIRGGKIESDNEDVDEDNEDNDNVDDGDFEGEGSITRRMKSILEKTPPITQVFLSSSIAITLLSAIFNQNIFPSFLLLNWKKIIKNGEVWRLITSFLYFGPLDLSYLLTLQFVWQYMSQLEKVHHKHPEEV